MTMTAARPLTDLPATLRATLPRHIAFIADGNRRWAADHGLTVEQGYEAGTAAVHAAIQQCRDLGVQAVSVFIASERNFDRPPAHVAALVKVVCGLVRTAAANADGPVRVIGDLTRVPLPLIDAIETAEKETAGLTGMSVCLGIGYDGQADIRRAAHRALLAPGRNKREAQLALGQFLSTRGLPELDLVVRTSGERRLSGFLLYEAADATLHFDDRMWPEWDDAALLEALAVHAAQTRKFGR
ncbi:polyprenyl diphosphate synthase [Streptomyces griseus]|uniref:polyprenyl diphosphate synthase n=1 Tax=Streptomyces griseus TaxID=1911 RepID=UPI00378BBBA5